MTSPTEDLRLAYDQARETLARWREERAARQSEHPGRLRAAYDRVAELRETTQQEAFTHNLEDIDQELAGGKAEPREPVLPFVAEDLEGYQPPPVDFLKPEPEVDIGVSEEQLQQQRFKLQATLDNFAIDAHVTDAQVGPRVTRFRVKPGYGVKVEQIVNLDKNIALNLASGAVRIQAPIPGEPYVGVEVPNVVTRPVFLRSSMVSPTWQSHKGSLPVVVGVDITDGQQILDLAAAPHLLIAGATGSGKSVCINNLLLSLVYRFHPGQLELVLVDPKKVEFALYKDLPHLIHPLVDDPKQACQALKWLVREMERRYDVLAEKRVRNLAGYNEKAAAEGFAPMSQIVLVVDELADLMMTAKDDVELPIARLAQMSRAVGIHTVLATQRPSVNVITGVIKANYPTRIAFKVSSQVDSRTILDVKGAETLQGKGDLLYQAPGSGCLQRLQSPFVSDDEINAITDHLRAQLEPRYRVELPEDDGSGSGSIPGQEDMDPLLRQALEIVATSQRASTSYIQRRLKIGYNRAANLIEEMEVRGYLGPQIENQPREIFIDSSNLS